MPRPIPASYRTAAPASARCSILPASCSTGRPESTSRTFPIAAWPKPMQDVAAGHIQMMHISIGQRAGRSHIRQGQSARHPRAAALLEAAGRPVDDGNPPRLSQAFDLVRIFRPRLTCRLEILARLNGEMRKATRAPDSARPDRKVATSSSSRICPAEFAKTANRTASRSSARSSRRRG